MRLAILMNLAPRKLGSMEELIATMCAIALERGHSVDVYGQDPIHPLFLKRLTALGVAWELLDSLRASPLRGIRRLSGYDVLHLNFIAPRTKTALMAYAAYPAKVLYVDHSSGPIPGTVTPKKPLVRVLRRVANSVTMVRVQGIAGVSEYVAERNRRQFAPARSRVRTIYNGVDMPRFASEEGVFDLDPKAQGAPERRDLKVLAVCYIIREKGLEYLIRGIAEAKNSELRLTIVGDGPLMDELKAQARALGVGERVEFTGLRNDVPRLLRECDIFAHPAIWQEACGLVVLEAMSNGLPVIATRMGGIPELLEHQRTGLLVDSRDARQIAEALDLLSERPELRRQLGRNAREKVKRRFEVSGCALEHVIWCENAARASARSGPLPASSAERPGGSTGWGLTH